MVNHATRSNCDNIALYVYMHLSAQKHNMYIVHLNGLDDQRSRIA